METVLMLIIIGLVAYIVYTRKGKPVVIKELTVEEMEKKKQEKYEKEFQNLLNYNEAIATKGHEDE